MKTTAEELAKKCVELVVNDIEHNNWGDNTMNHKLDIAKKILEITALSELLEVARALVNADQHLDFCGYGDKYERECAASSKLSQQIKEALINLHNKGIEL